MASLPFQPGLFGGFVVGGSMSRSALNDNIGGNNPKTEVLGRAPDDDHFVDPDAHPDAVPEPGVLVYRVDSVLFYANTSVVRDDLEARASTPATGRSTSSSSTSPRRRSWISPPRSS